MEDLERFKLELKEELMRSISSLLKERYRTPSKRWLKTHEVCRLLALSPGTLASLRARGELPFKKIGNVIFYDYKDIETMLEVRSKERNYPTRGSPPLTL